LAGHKTTYEELEARLVELQHRLDQAQELIEALKDPLSQRIHGVEEELQQKTADAITSKATLDAIMNHIPEGITVTSRSSQLIVMESRYGLDLECRSLEEKNLPLKEGIAAMKMRHPGNPHPAPVEETPLWRATMFGETIKEEEWTFSGAKGQDVVLMINAGPILDATGNITGAVAGWRDVTERKVLENELRRREEQYTRMFAINPDPIVVSCFRSGKILQVNRAFVEETGWSSEEIVGMDASVGWADKKRRQAFRQAILREGECHDFEANLRIKNGELRQCLLSAKRLEMTDWNVILTVIHDVTRQKRAEEALRQNEQLLTRVLDALPVGVAIVDKQAKVTRVNPAFENIWGGELKDDFGAYKGWHVATNEPVKPEEWTIVRAVARGETNLNEQILIRGFDGVNRYILCSGVPIKGSGGEVTGAIAVMENITDTFIARAALRQSEEMYKGLVQATGVLVLKANLQGYITFLNQYAKEFFQCNDRGIGAYAADLFTAKDESQRKAIETKTMEIISRQSQVPYVESESFDQQGQPVWIAWSVRPVTDLQGNVTEMQGVGLNITERKRAEQAVQQSEAKLRTLIEALPAMVWVVKPDGTFEYVNQLWCDYTGYSPEQAEQWLETIHPEDREQTLERVEKANITGEIYNVEHRVRRRDGAFRWHISRAVALKNDGVSGFRWLGTSTDIHDQKIVEHDLRRLTEELERSNKELEDFAYVASHDLQEPLRMITGYLQLIERRYKGKLDKDADEFIAYAVDGATRMQRLIADLLAYSRVGTRGRALAPIDLTCPFERAQADLWRTISETGTRITHDPLPKVRGDETQLAQLFLNLLGNAIKFRSDRIPEIHVGVEDKEKEWLISISDNGIGFDQRYGDRVFQVFQRLHTRQKYPGTGIGLAICKKIVDRHGGKIWVESERGKGSTFYVALPKPGEESWT